MKKINTIGLKFDESFGKSTLALCIEKAFQELLKKQKRDNGKSN